MKNKIIVPIDFEEQSIKALDYAKYFATITGAEITLLHVIEESNFFKKLFKDGDENKKLEKAVEEQLNKLAETFEPEYKVKTKIKHGKIYEEIEDFIEDEEPLFTLIGKTEKPSLKKRLLGSNTLHIVNESDFPVISISGKKTHESLKKYNKEIILPLDLMKHYEEQVTAAIEFAKIFKSSIKVISVDRVDSVLHDTKQLTRLNQVGKTIEKAGIKCDTKIIDDKKTPIAEIINNYAIENNSHLVIIMTRDEDNIKEFFLGSNARRILQTCEVPVLSVEPWDKDDNENAIFEFIYDIFD